MVIVALHFRLAGVTGQGGHFLGDVDASRAPGDTAAAADAPGRAELVVPGTQLVADPLAVPAGPGLAHAAAVQVREGQLEAGSPVLPALGVLAGQVGDVLGAG